MQTANYQARAIGAVASALHLAAIPAASSTQWPRITLITPVYNGVRFIEETIRSIVYQGYPNLEYIVVDGGSSDGTVDIIRKYEKHISWWISHRDNGVYDALNNGFAHSTGDIMGWLNASDLLHTNGLFVVGSVFACLPAVEWLIFAICPAGLVTASWLVPTSTSSRNRRSGAGVCGKKRAEN
jgi:glycosyltransferase involved in cell wall biosynthesis